MSSDIKLLVQMTNLSTKLASELFRLTKLNLDANFVMFEIQ